MVNYSVTSFDDSANGMERLRDQSEFILLAYPWSDSVSVDMRRQWIDDIQSSDCFENFDYDAAREAVNSWYNDGGEEIIQRAIQYLNSQIENWDDLDDCEESPVFRLYVNVTEES